MPYVSRIPVTVGESCVVPKTHVKDLGVVIDQHLSMQHHINRIVSAASLKIREISFQRRFLKKDALNTIVHAWVTSKVDYCNSLLVGLPNTLLRKLQSVLNTAARLVSGTRKYDRITPSLKDLHWLPI